MFGNDLVRFGPVRFGKKNSGSVRFGGSVKILVRSNTTSVIHKLLVCMIKIDFSLLWVYYVDLRTLMPSLHYTNRLGVCYDHRTFKANVPWLQNQISHYSRSLYPNDRIFNKQ